LSYAAGLSVLNLFSQVAASSVSGNRLLVIQDTPTTNQSYSNFWASLNDRGFDLTFREPKTDGAPLMEFGERQHDHLIIFAPKAKAFSADITPKKLFDFLNAGGNVLLSVTKDVSEFWRDWAREFEVEFDDRDTSAIDHFSYDVELDDDSHTTLAVSVPQDPSPILSKATRTGPPVLYRGLAHSTTRSPLVTPVLTGKPTTYSFELAASAIPDGEVPLSGSSVSLVSVFQARNNARLAFCGSLDVFSDAFVESSVTLPSGKRYPKSGNSAFIRDISQWVFQEKGVVKVVNVGHSLTARSEANPLLYRVGDSIDFQIELSVYSGGSWKPFYAEDVQLEFTMLDPHIRIPLARGPKIPGSASSIYSATFNAPDRHGVFTFLVDYRRRGYSNIRESIQTSVTPPRHDEYDRYIVGAIPFYGGSVAVLLSFIILSVLWTTGTSF